MENTAPLSLASHILLRNYGSLIFCSVKDSVCFCFSCSLKFVLLFGFQQLYEDIIGYSHLCIYSVWGSECFWICYLISSVSFVSFLAVISSYINSLSLLSFPSEILITGDIFNIFTFSPTSLTLFWNFPSTCPHQMFFLWMCFFQFTKCLLWCI